MSADAATETGQSLEVAEVEIHRLPLSDNPPKKQNPLNPRQIKFLDNYLEKGMTATNAYLDAYKCQKKWARSASSHLLSTNSNIIAAVDEWQELEAAATKRALHGKSTKAAEVLGNALESEDINAVIRAAKEILDRTGHNSKYEVEHGGEISVSKAILDGSYYSKIKGD